MRRAARLTGQRIGCSIRSMRLALVTVGALAAVLAGCGGVEREPNLAKAVERTEATGSSRLEIRALEMEEGKTEVKCEGAADYVRKRFRLECEDLAPDEVVEILVIAATMYIRGMENAGLGSSNRWSRLPLEDDDPIFDFSPEKLLAMLRAASRETERIGEEDVRGESTVRYRLMVNCEEAQLAGCPSDTAPVEVWIDDDGLVRRISVEDGGSTATIEFFDFGVEVDVEPPPADQVLAIDEPCEPGDRSPSPARVQREPRGERLLRERRGRPHECA